MKKVLFLIHDLGQGGAEKVLVNLVNNLDKEKFDVTVMSLFDVGENKQNLDSSVHYKYCFKYMIRGNSYLMKLLSPKQLHNWLIKDYYDIEIAFLEGPSARVISGCNNKDTKLVSWIHCQFKESKEAAASFRNIEEATECYNKFNKVICVSNDVRNSFKDVLNLKIPVEVLYNTNDSESIIRKGKESVSVCKDTLNIIGIGKLTNNKGFHRVLPIVNKLIHDDNLKVHYYILGSGSLENKLKEMIDLYKLNDSVTLLGYQMNPYKYLSKMDLYVCSSYSEGFSTATTEALILGIPTCTVDVPGMKEMLGENEYGLITENVDEELYKGIKILLCDSNLLEHYKKQALIRGKTFSLNNTTKAVEEMLMKLFEEVV